MKLKQKFPKDSKKNCHIFAPNSSISLSINKSIHNVMELQLDLYYQPSS